MIGWDEIESAVRECDACRLCDERRNAVPGEGRRAADIMLIGEGDCEYPLCPPWILLLPLCNAGHYVPGGGYGGGLISYCGYTSLGDWFTVQSLMAYLGVAF